MYQFYMRPRISEYDTVAEFTSAFRPSKADLILTERFLFDQYLADSVEASALFLDDYGLGEPSDIVVDKLLGAIRGRKVERIFGIGGGTIMDIAKLLCVKDATTTEEIFDDLVPPIRDKGLVLIPTTCGTGCEMTCVSVVDMSRRGTKVGKRIDANFADDAVLIPQLLDRIPENVFRYSSIDALIHAMEIYVAPTGNPYNDVFCASAIRAILSRYRILAEEGLERRHAFIGEFLRASTFAGIALANTACGAVHALAMHFGSVHHVAHGLSNSLFLIPVFRKYQEMRQEGKVAELAKIVAAAIGSTPGGAFDALADLISQILPAKRLSDFGAAEGDLPSYADKVIESQQRLLKNNFVPFDKSDLLDIYRAVY